MRDLWRFSALQRAENSSNHHPLAVNARPVLFQCSSASRKFLNSSYPNVQGLPIQSFSALQRAENSSNETYCGLYKPPSGVSVLFSEPKIPQCAIQISSRPALSAFQCSSASRKFLNSGRPVIKLYVDEVSVLFSEPKIPQSRNDVRHDRERSRFSALQRAENSSIGASSTMPMIPTRVSVLFSEPKIPQCLPRSSGRAGLSVSVLFSEPKIPQLVLGSGRTNDRPCFSALQRAENSSISVTLPHNPPRVKVSVLFSEPKIPQFWSQRTR